MDCADSNDKVAGNSVHTDALRRFVDALPWCVDGGLAFTQLARLAGGQPGLERVQFFLRDDTEGDFILHPTSFPGPAESIHEGAPVVAAFTQDDSCSRITLNRTAGATLNDPSIGKALEQLDECQADAALAIRAGSALAGLALVSFSTAEGCVVDASLDALETAARELSRVLPEILRTESAGVVGTISTGVAHDLKSCLVSVSTLLQLCEEDPMPEAKIAELLPTAGANLKAAEEIIAQARNTPALDAFQVHPVDFMQAVETAMALVEDEARASRVRLQLEALEPARVRGHDVLIVRLVRNLVSNAIHASPAGGEVRVSVLRAEGDANARLVVADDGPGMGMDTRRRVLSQKPDDLPCTSGLGLPICRHVALQFGGRLEIDSKPGCGATVTVSLPVWSESDGEQQSSTD